MEQPQPYLHQCFLLFSLNNFFFILLVTLSHWVKLPLNSTPVRQLGHELHLHDLWMPCLISFFCKKPLKSLQCLIQFISILNFLFPLALFPFLKHIQRVCNSKVYGNIPFIHTCILFMVLWAMDMQLLLEQKLKVKGMLFSGKLWSRRKQCRNVTAYLAVLRTVITISFKW
jgi:hypothetical protein